MVNFWHWWIILVCCSAKSSLFHLMVVSLASSLSVFIIYIGTTRFLSFHIACSRGVHWFSQAGWVCRILDPLNHWLWEW